MWKKKYLQFIKQENILISLSYGIISGDSRKVIEKCEGEEFML